MKIALLGIEGAEGKVKYNDVVLNALVEKFTPKKISPFFAEITHGDFIGADATIVSRGRILDFLIMDMEKIEARMGNATDEKEISQLKKYQHYLEQEKPLCDMEATEPELLHFRELAPLSRKPTLIVDGPAFPINELITLALDKAGMMFFYTAGPKEVRSWLVRKNSDAVTCAGKIHSDLARGFIKAEIVNVQDFLMVHNMQEAKTKGIVKLVDRDYIIQPGDMLDIRFNV
jgi:ribosome-binding ATPase YchF (GTP1/OBG family)